MDNTDLEILKSRIGKRVEIITLDGERVIGEVISVFDGESEPDVFFWDLTGASENVRLENSEAHSLLFAEIAAVTAIG